MIRSCLLTLVLIASAPADELAFEATSKENLPASQAMQSLLLNSSKTMKGARDSLKRVPRYYRTHVGIYQSGDYYVTRYQNSAYPKILPWITRDFKQAGFSDALIVMTGNDAPITASKKTGLHSSLPKTASTPKIAETSVRPSPLTQHDQTRLILDASRAFDQHDYTQATIYYEMMAASGMQDRQILFNLAYLYGREGSFGLLEKKIEGKRGTNDYLYAYGVGALEARRSDLYTTLSPHLMYDKSGKLSMLCGYFFEQENDSKRAAAFYKMAYDANPSDPHILYAYARSVDLSGNKEQALYCYTQLSQLGSEFEILRTTAQSRIQTLRSMQ